MNTNNLVPSSASTPLAQLGHAANQSAAQHVFDDYRQRRAANTLRRQRADLALFATFLQAFHVSLPNHLQDQPESWRGITWGLIEGFKQWQLQQGYTVQSINVRLSTVKKYAALAFKAGALSAEEHALIRTVTGYTHHESKHVDEQRTDLGLSVRRKNAKKANPISISTHAAKILKQNHPETPQGRRDALLMCLLLDHGLRCGEIALLNVGHFNLSEGTMTFYRPKVGKIQTHELSRDTQRALEAYVNLGDCPETADAPLLRSSNKSGRLTKPGMSERAITKRVNDIGMAQDIPNLSAHDGRHSWATRAARNGTDPFALQEAGGWNSLAMPRRYVEEAQIANQGVKLE